MGILSICGQRQRDPRGAWEMETTSFVRWAVQLPWLGTIQWPTWISLLFPWLVGRACHSPGVSSVPGCEWAWPSSYPWAPTLILLQERDKEQNPSET